jgi:hypothetical protein
MNAVFDFFLAKVNHEAQPFVRLPQVRRELGVEDWVVRLDRFRFHDHQVLHNQVDYKALL